MIYKSDEKREPDIKAVYKTVDGTELPLWIYLPESIKEDVKTVICIHGGAWEAMRSGEIFDGQTMSYQADYFSRIGYIGAVISYRSIHTDGVTIKNLVEDCADAVSYLLKNYKFVNRENIILMGDSAGAQLAFALTEKSVLEIIPECAVLCNPVSKLDDARWRITSWQKEERIKYSPLFMVERVNEKTRFLLMHGDNDTVVNISDTEELYHRLKTLGADVEFKSVPNAKHAFILFNYESNDETVCRYMRFIDDFINRRQKGEKVWQNE